MKIELRKIGETFNIFVDNEFKTRIPTKDEKEAEELFTVFVNNEKYNQKSVTSITLKTVKI